MKRTLYLLAAVAVAAVILAPAVHAQCSSALVFESRLTSGTDDEGTRMDVRRSTSENTAVGTVGADMVGRIWCSQNLSLGNNFDGNCPPTVWFDNTAAGPCSNKNRCISGAISGTGCSFQGGCPADNDCDLTVLVEDTQTNNDNALYAIWRVDITAAAGRTWDYGRVDDAVDPAIRLTAIPRVEVTSSTVDGTDLDLDTLYVDLAIGYKEAGGAAAQNNIKEWVIYSATGDTYPGNDRTLTAWTEVTRIPYNGSEATGSLVIDCEPEQNVQLATAITFKDDAGNTIDGTYVGRSVLIACDPAMADPQNPATIMSRPKRPGGTTTLQRGGRGTDKRR